MTEAGSELGSRVSRISLVSWWKTSTLAISPSRNWTTWVVGQRAVRPVAFAVHSIVVYRTMASSSGRSQMCLTSAFWCQSERMMPCIASQASRPLWTPPCGSEGGSTISKSGA